MPVLQKEYGFSKMYLWGKLKGLASDYIIAVGVSHSLKETTKKYFYWCARLCRPISPALGRGAAHPPCAPPRTPRARAAQLRWR